MTNRKVTLDLVVHRPESDTFVMYLVEEGPWDEADLDDELHRILARLNDLIDVAIDGHLAGMYPDSKGRAVVIRLDCYDTPEQPVRGLFEAFVEHFRSSEEMQRDLQESCWVSSLGFEYNWDTLEDKG